MVTSDISPISAFRSLFVRRLSFRRLLSQADLDCLGLPMKEVVGNVINQLATKQISCWFTSQGVPLCLKRTALTHISITLFLEGGIFGNSSAPFLHHQLQEHNWYLLASDPSPISAFRSLFVRRLSFRRLLYHRLTRIALTCLWKNWPGNVIKPAC